MSALIQTIRRTLALAFVCLIVTAPGVSAAPALIADFDGDGHHDHASLDARNPSLLRVWLSATRTVSILHARSPIHSVAARDLDGDRRDELIAGGTPGLQVWTTHHTGFRPFHRRPGSPHAQGAPPPHTVGDGAGSDLDVDAPTGAASVVLARSPQLCGPAVAASVLPPASICPAVAARVIAPFAPRPPPLSL